MQPKPTSQPRNTAVLNLGISRFTLNLLGPLPGISARREALLQLPQGAAPAHRSAGARSLLLKGLEAALSQWQSEESIIIVGSRVDPFLGAGADYETALAAIEMLAKTKARLIAIQTRSPLVVLAMPVLKALNERAAVTIAVECLDDIENEALFPASPAPEERLKAALALKNLGVATIIQASPLISLSSPTEAGAIEYAQRIAPICHGVKVAPLSEITGKEQHDEILSAGYRASSVELHEHLRSSFPALLPENWGAGAAARRAA